MSGRKRGLTLRQRFEEKYAVKRPGFPGGSYL